MESESLILFSYDCTLFNQLTWSPVSLLMKVGVQAPDHQNQSFYHSLLVHGSNLLMFKYVELIPGEVPSRVRLAVSHAPLMMSSQPGLCSQ